MGGRPAWWALGVAIHLCCRYSYTNQAAGGEPARVRAGCYHIAHVSVYICIQETVQDEPTTANQSDYAPDLGRELTRPKLSFPDDFESLWSIISI